MPKVLLKKIDETGLELYTNYESRKATELRINPHAAAVFYWEKLSRQINVEGAVETVSREISEKYFHTRSRESQIAAWSSKQGKEISGKNVLEEAFEQLVDRYQNTTIPLPPFWGGFRLIPHRFEFWQGGSHRLHDRFQYLKEKGSWTMARLSP
jgi:pyridoxamine 5'-phosphate oxidase